MTGDINYVAIPEHCYMGAHRMNHDIASNHHCELKNKVVVITGGCGGIGKATCFLLAQHGCRIAILDIDTGNAELVIAEIRRLGGDGYFVEADIRNSSNCKSAISSVCEYYGTIDIVINAAGIITRSSIIEMSEDEWDNLLNVNLKSIFLISKYALNELIKKGEGVIVNVASGWGISAGARAAAYCASKGAVIQLTKAMAIDHGPQGIRVNCISPGDTDTGMLRSEEQQLGLPVNFLNDAAKNRPLGRVGQGNDIANGILFLVSHHSLYVTGTTSIVDGGGIAGTM